MNNPNYFKGLDLGSDDEKYLGEGLISFIDQDYLLSYLNEVDSNPKRNQQAPNLFHQASNDMHFPFPNYQDPLKFAESMPSMMPKMNINDTWVLHSMNERTNPYNMISPQPQKTDVSEEYEGNVKTKKVKTSKENGTRKTFQATETSSRGNYKSNIKNTYINKINSLISEAPEEKPAEKLPKEIFEIEGNKKGAHIKNEHSESHSSKGGMKRIRSFDVLKSDEIDKLNEKLAKNRESARNSRKRKKIYIELLEKKVDQLNQELTATRKQLELNSSNLNKICFQSKLMTGLISGRMQLFDKLEKMIQSETDENEINLLIDSLRLRLGATGKERVNAINFFFRQIVDLLIPVHMKYLLWIACEGKDLFSTKDTTLINSIPNNMIPSTDLQNEVTDYWSDLVHQVNLTDSQKKSILKYRKKLVNEKQKFESLINQLNQVRKSILKQSNSLQNVIDDFRNILSPVQTGKFLILLDKERNRKEFTAEKLWQSFSMKKENEVKRIWQYLICKDGESEEDSDFLDNPETNEDGQGRDPLTAFMPSMEMLESLKGGI